MKKIIVGLKGTVLKNVVIFIQAISKAILCKFENKISDLVEDFNLNLVDRTNTKVKDIVNLTFQNLLTPVIKKPTRITKTIAALTDHILANDFVNTDSSKDIVKIDT